MPRLILFRMVLRSFFIQGTWNYERMQGLGYCFCMLPFVKKNLSDKNRRAEFYKQNLGFFNTQPYLASWVLGATAKLYEAYWSTGKPSAEEIRRFKKHFGQSLAATGDTFFWSLLRPVSAMAGLVLALHVDVLTGIFAFLLLFNLPHFYVRFIGVYAGYKKGFDVVRAFSMNKYRNLLSGLGKAAAFFTGLCAIAFAPVGTDFVQLAAFIAAVLMTYFFLKFNLSISYILIIVITVIVAIGSV